MWRLHWPVSVFTRKPHGGENTITCNRKKKGFGFRNRLIKTTPERFAPPSAKCIVTELRKLVKWHYHRVLFVYSAENVLAHSTLRVRWTYRRVFLNLEYFRFFYVARTFQRPFFEFRIGILLFFQLCTWWVLALTSTFLNFELYFCFLNVASNVFSDWLIISNPLLPPPQGVNHFSNSGKM